MSGIGIALSRAYDHVHEIDRERIEKKEIRYQEIVEQEFPNGINPT